MEFSQEDLQSLVDLGLTFVQAKIFLTLIQTGIIKAQTISKLTKVSRADVYRTLAKLQEDGLVEKQISKPALFSAIPEKDAFNLLMERQTLKHRELKFKTANLLRKYQKEKHSSFHQFGFVFVPSREALIKRLNKAIERTHKSIDISTTCKRLTSAGFSLSENLTNAWDRGVKGRAVIDVSEDRECDAIKEFWCAPYAEIRYIPRVPKTVMALYDKTEVFVFTNPSAQLNESPALWSNVPSLVAMATDYFEILWSTAMERPDYHLDGTNC